MSGINADQIKNKLQNKLELSFINKLLTVEESIILLLGIFVRWCVSLYPYSGAGKPPMFGDYEAQRHWQELTINLPINEWYRNGTDNDLMYWGIDYPPLSSYHSYMCGKVAQLLNPKYVTLYSSRGYESDYHKLFMRYSVFIADIIIYFFGALLVCRSTFMKATNKTAILAVLLLYPGLYLIDYGHFQYNNVSLGLFLISIACYFNNRDCIGSAFFCFALNYKQMELYHALPIFFYLFGLSFKQKTYYRGCSKVFKLGITVLFSMVICWMPFLLNAQSAQDVLLRMFPINRGLYEDKVASFWCSVNIIIKIRQVLANSQLAFFCLFATIFFSLPSCIHLFFNPTKQTLKYSLFNVSMSFFMFSFHVHEKSILLAAIPCALLFDSHPLSVIWFLQITTLSMFPLLVKDGLTVPVLALTVFCYILYDFKYGSKAETLIDKFLYKVYSISVLMLFILCLLSLFVSPPDRYPDLFPVIISVLCFFMYFNIFIYFNYCQYGDINPVRFIKKNA